MFFRFGSAIVLVVLVSLAGIAMEKRNLEYRRGLSRQHYRMQVLLDGHTKLRMKTQQMGAPVRLIESLEKGEFKLREPETPVEARAGNLPLLRWQRATRFSR